MATKKPWWVKQRRFAIPSTLRDRIKDLPEQEQIYYCFIVHKVRVETKDEPTQLKGISSQYFNDFIGSHYRRYIDKLIGWNIIVVSEHYQNNEGRGFPKAYRLHRSVADGPFVKKRFKKKQTHRLKPDAEPSDEVARFVHSNCKRLGIRTDLAQQANDVDEVDAEDGAEQIFWGRFNLRYGKKVNRLYHAIIEMPRVGRKNLFLADNPNIPLYEYDIKSCHPVLLLQVMEDHKEKEELRALVSGDFYTTVASECGVQRDREMIKKDYAKFTN